MRTQDSSLRFYQEPRPMGDESPDFLPPTPLANSWDNVPDSMLLSWLTVDKLSLVFRACTDELNTGTGDPYLQLDTFWNPIKGILRKCNHELLFAGIALKICFLIWETNVIIKKKWVPEIYCIVTTPYMLHINHSLDIKNIFSHLRQNHTALLTFVCIHWWCFLMVHLSVKLGDRH